MAAILSKTEQERLTRQVAEVERGTAGELVVVVLDKSAPYAEYRLAGALVIGLLVVSAVHLCWPWIPAMELLGAELLVIGLLFYVLGGATVLRYMIPRPMQRKAVNDRIKQLFVELGVTETRDRSGVLILLSALERRIEILGDRGIYEHLGAQAWQGLVQSFTQAARRGAAADGLSQVIERLGRELSAHFPPRADDVNELSNEIRMGQ
jgi:putative membrane protein